MERIESHVVVAIVVTWPSLGTAALVAARYCCSSCSGMPNNGVGRESKLAIGFVTYLLIQ